MRIFKNLLIAGTAVIFIMTLVYSFLNIIQWKNDVDDNYTVKQEIDKSIMIDNGSLIIDFASLKKENSDTVGYLKVNGTNIDYVVVQADDNEYYLTHSFNRKNNIAGWIFADYRNVLNGSDKNLIIYGHNTKDGSMFGSLINVVDESWQSIDDNLVVVFLTEKREYRYIVFSTYLTSPEDYYLSTDFNDKMLFDDFVESLKKRSKFDYGVEVNGDDHILTLSSCVGNGEQRVVLHAKQF